jgi:hypothetical protein
VSDRLPSDHEAVTSYRVHVEQLGRTGRPRVPLPEGLDAAPGDVVRLSLEGDAHHAAIREDVSGEADIRGAYANARLARAGEEGDGENAFRAWVTDAGLSVGDVLLLDVVTPGYAYGLRRPGERVIYDAVDPPDGGLADIARDL